MKTLFSRRDLFAVFASVFLCVFMVGVITYGATITISSTGVGSGTSTPGAAIGAKGGAIIEDFVYMSYFTATSTTATSTVRFGLNVATSSFNVNGNSGAVTIGTTTVPDADVAGTMALDPSFTVSGVGSAYNATGTVYVAGGGTKGGQIIIKSSNGANCISIMANSVANDPGAVAMSATTLLDVDVVECPR
jgi:hypothetical protein